MMKPFQKTLSSAPEITYKLIVQLCSEKEGPIDGQQVVFPFVNWPVYLIWDVALSRSGGVEEVREIDGVYRRVIQGARSCCWVGDLDGDNRCDFVHGVSAQHIAAYRYDGKLLWRWDDQEGVAIYNSASVRVFDVNGDGKAEVVCRQGDEICILEGATGKRLASMLCPPTRLPGGLGEHGPRFYFANFRGLSSPRDILMELGEVNQSTLVALQGEDLKELWRFDVTAQMKQDGGAGGHCPVVEDMDGDGKDEVAFGTYLLDHSGKIRWSKSFASIGMGDEEDHVDCIEVGDLFGNGEKAVVYSTNGVVLRAEDGKELWRHNTRHGQWVRILRVLPNTDDSQILLADKYELPILLDSSGKRLNWPFPVATFCLPDWDGDGQREAVSGGIVWDLK
ncbi:VCBS repeat-containing protein, partial [Candidatus Bipolaricaulota bacterium]|nr:VCBS repeat-containing protein [Candidatus Bipolaricaulota bacterium]